MVDIEDLAKHYSKAERKNYATPTLEDAKNLLPLLKELIRSNTKLEILKRKYSFQYRNSYLLQAFELMQDEFQDVELDTVRELLKIKRGKSTSGIISITVFTSGESFSCKWNCAYCPNEPGQPRSYLKGEPGVLRANANKFDCVDQIHDRMNTLYKIGHEIDKIEILVLGGTWTSYPIEYRENFINDIYYAANTFFQQRERKTLEEEKYINRRSKNCRIIGLTLETRPDTINKKELQNFRRYGCTRVQLGIQHINDDILRKINRGCSSSDVKKAIKLLKDSGFKIDGHWMPNLPGSDVRTDEKMLIDKLLGVKSKTYSNLNYQKYSLTCPEFQVDQWKVYPCTIVPFTEIQKWYLDGSYVPYNLEDLTNLLLKMKSLVFPWIRLNRIVRDIPEYYSLSEEYSSNLRQHLDKILKKDGVSCRCIRCREVKDRPFEEKDSVINIAEYDASDATEYFISLENKTDDILYGFCRLRLTDSPASHIFPELRGCALIRELHVYGLMNNNVQHKGVGKRLVNEAIRISKQHGYQKISVISGEGVKNYYQNLGFQDTSNFMIKNIS